MHIDSTLMVLSNPMGRRALQPPMLALEFACLPCQKKPFREDHKVAATFELTELAPFPLSNLTKETAWPYQWMELCAKYTLLKSLTHCARLAGDRLHPAADTAGRAHASNQRGAVRPVLWPLR